MTEEKKLNIQKLLDATGSIIDKYKALSYETGSKFNIFEIADIETDERIVCRVLHELLSPIGRHGQGGAYLEIFLRDCLKMEFSKDEINRAEVRREYPANGRYVDITIKIGKRFIPIEVKIWAGDQERQCLDYYHSAKRFDENAQVIYLTPDGHAPSSYSAEGLTKDGEGYAEVRQISFAAEILEWLKASLSISETIRKAPIREIIMQFISAIEKFTGKLEDRPMNEMIKLLSESERNMLNAHAIADTLAVCEKEMRKKFFDAFCERFNRSEHSVEILQLGSYDEHEDKWPGVYYKVEPEVEPGINLAFYLEADVYRNPLYAGFQFMKNEERVNDDIEMMRHLAKYFIGIEASDSKKWAIFQENISFDGEGIHLIRIKRGDSNYFKLFDPDKFDKIIDETVNQVNSMFSRIKL